MQQVLVSVIVPVYNAEKYLTEALNSVIAQTHTLWECIIIDDGSTDASGEVAASFCRNDRRFQYHWQANGGASSARNRGFDLASGEYIQYLDADDVILPVKMEAMLRESQSLEDHLILYSDMTLGQQHNIYEAMPLRFSLNLGHDVTFEETYKEYALAFGITPACFFFPRKVLENVKWNVEIGPGEDWDYFLQILDNGYQFRFFPQVLVLYRNTEQSYSKNSFKSFNSAYRVLFDWAAKKNKYLFYFSKRCAFVYKKSVFLFLTGKSDTVIKPKFDRKKAGIGLSVFILLIYPIALLYILNEFKNIIIKRTGRVLFKRHQ